MPSKLYNTPRVFPLLRDSIIRLAKKHKPIIHNELYILETYSEIYCYFQESEISLICKLQKHKDLLLIQTTAKNKTSNHYASDLYLSIVDYYKMNLMSGTQLTIHSFKIWQRLFRAGHKISVYDNINDIIFYSELDQFYGNQKSQYQFVLRPCK